MFGLLKSVFYRINIFVNFNGRKLYFVELYLNEQSKCKVRPQVVNANGEEPVFFPFSIKIRKCTGSCHNINDPYAKLCVSDVVKNLNVKVVNLMSRTNETRHIE